MIEILPLGPSPQGHRFRVQVGRARGDVVIATEAGQPGEREDVFADGEIVGALQEPGVVDEVLGLARETLRRGPGGATRDRKS